MLTNTLTAKDTQSLECRGGIKVDSADSKLSKSFHENTTAALSDHDISALSRVALVRLLQSIRVPIYENHVATRLEYLNRDTLERMVYLTRRYCRNRMVIRYTTRPSRNVTSYRSAGEMRASEQDIDD